MINLLANASGFIGVMGVGLTPLGVVATIIPNTNHTNYNLKI